MKRLLPLLLTLATPALAEDAVIYADCGAQGCTCHISALPNAEIAQYTGIPTPENAGQLTLVGKDGRFHWSSAPRSEIDLASGGDGSCEIEVFQEIVPLDGTWAGTVDATGNRANWGAISTSGWHVVKDESTASVDLTDTTALTMTDSD